MILQTAHDNFSTTTGMNLARIRSLPNLQITQNLFNNMYDYFLL